MRVVGEQWLILSSVWMIRVPGTLAILAIMGEITPLRRVSSCALCGMAAALLMLPESTSWDDLYRTIASISYLGDVRQRFFVDRDKVSRIVGANRNGFSDMYGTLVRAHSSVRDSDKNRIVQDTGPGARSYLADSLPAAVQKNLNVVNPAAEQVQRALRKIVAASSRSQMIKGIFTAEALRSLNYNWSKFTKSLRRAVS